MDFKALPSFRGINNRLPADRMRPIGDREEGVFVRDAVNVDLTEAGSFQRRPGVTRIGEDTNCRGLFGARDVGYYGAGDKLRMLDANGLAVDVATLPSPFAPLCYTDTPLGVVCSDTYSLRLLKGASVSTLVPEAPNPVPTVGVASGGLPAGAYSVAFATVDGNGQRSKLTYPEVVTVPDGGALDITLVAHSSDIVVFISAVNGEVLYAEDRIPAGQTTRLIPVVASSGEPVVYQHMDSMPAGEILAHSNGRLFSATDRYLAFSLPFIPGLYRPARDYIAMPDPITLLAAAEDGLFIATMNGTWFLPGSNVASSEMKQVAPFGAVRGTLAQVPNSIDLMWFSERGPVRETNGSIKLLQDQDIAFAPAQAGAAIVREENGLRSFLTALTGNSPSAAAVVGSYMDAEVIK